MCAAGDRGAEVTHDQKLWYDRENGSLHLHCTCRTSLPVLGALRVGDIFTDVKEFVKDGIRCLHVCPSMTHPPLGPFPLDACHM